MRDRLKEFWTGRRVFVTGNTGFKGSWLLLALHRLEALVRGYSLPPPTSPSLFEAAKLQELLKTDFSDVRDFQSLEKSMLDFSPEIVFHLAAQPIVRESYRDPAGTFAVNAMGTVSLLEACRRCPSVRAIVAVTTDKCYDNPSGSKKPFAEDDKLGGHDPYSASKACAEIIAASYRDSFFDESSSPGLATARAGNVIGGGDWAPDRLLPDFFRAAASGAPMLIRNPGHVRPWQHVLDAIYGYLLLAMKLSSAPREFSGAWNFGPDPSGFKSVREVMESLLKAWPGKPDCSMSPPSEAMAEAPFLTLDASKAKARLGWAPKLDTGKAVSMTADWHKLFTDGASARDLSLSQIDSFLATEPHGH